MQGHTSRRFSFFFLVLLALLCLGNSGIKISRVVPVCEQKHWTAARTHCRKTYSDLAKLQNELDFSRVEKYEGWIGLYLAEDNKWKWSADSGKIEDVDLCVFKNESGFEIDKCEHQRPYLCMDEDLILFPELRTWEEAVQYCRELKALHPAEEETRTWYDLASMPGNVSILMNPEESGVDATNEVWVGLRFLAGRWMWLSGRGGTGPRLPNCPTQHQRCGALTQNSSQWRMIDCSERRSFICSINA